MGWWWRIITRWCLFKSRTTKILLWIWPSMLIHFIYLSKRFFSFVNLLFRIWMLIKFLKMHSVFHHHQMVQLLVNQYKVDIIRQCNIRQIHINDKIAINLPFKNEKREVLFYFWISLILLIWYWHNKKYHNIWLQ